MPFEAALALPTSIVCLAISPTIIFEHIAGVYLANRIKETLFVRDKQLVTSKKPNFFNSGRGCQDNFKTHLCSWIGNCSSSQVICFLFNSMTT